MYDINSIFREYGNSYREGIKIPVEKLKVMEAIESCRTAHLGLHIEECLACNHKRISYNSCRNRHCPKCQNIAKEEWVDARKSELMNTHYFHVVFTVPDLLNKLIYNNKKQLYNLLFKCASQTLTDLAMDNKYLGAQIGINCYSSHMGTKSFFSSSYPLHCTRRRFDVFRC